MESSIISKTSYRVTTPVLFMVFNRLDLTKKTFKAIRKAKPEKIYFASDGARNSHIGEREVVDSIRDFVLNGIDWECQVETLFRDENLGCKNAISSAIDWLFESEEQGIIIEDDCVPSYSFFIFCQEILETYKDDKSIMHINGNYYLNGACNLKSDYYLSKINGVWGWATWKRAWKYYDSSMEGYLSNKKKGVISKYFENSDMDYWMTQYFDDVFFNQNGSNWDPVWSYAIVKNNAFCISPSVNLVKNIGFSGDSSTHGSSASFLKYEKFENEEIDSLTHPDKLVYNPNVDAMQMRIIVKSTDPVFMVKDYKHYLKKILFPSRYPSYIKKVVLKIKTLF